MWSISSWRHRWLRDLFGGSEPDPRGGGLGKLTEMVLENALKGR